MSFPHMASPKGKAIVLMGPSGAGKSTIGQMLGKAINGRFVDADDFHSPSNKGNASNFGRLARKVMPESVEFSFEGKAFEKMRNGIPLSEEDRVPWLETLRDKLRESITKGQTTVLACSALQTRYREILKSVDASHVHGGICSVRFVLLDVRPDVLADRLSKRAAEGKHFMPPKLLKSQLDLLQIDESEGILKIGGTLIPQDIVSKIQASLN